MKFATMMAGGLLALGTVQAQAGVTVDINLGCPPPRPVIYGPVVDQVWVPAVTQTVVQNVWHEPVTQDQVTQTWCPDRYEVRDVVVGERHGRSVIVRQTVLVEQGHWTDVHTPIVVRAGYYAAEPQTVIVTPGHWETVARPVIVRGPICEPAPVVVLPPPGPYGPGPWRDHRGYGHDYDRGYGERYGR